MSLIKDLSGMQFGRLTVLFRTDDYVSKSGYKKTRWHCLCRCGKEVDVTSDLLKKEKPNLVAVCNPNLLPRVR